MPPIGEVFEKHGAATADFSVIRIGEAHTGFWRARVVTTRVLSGAEADRIVSERAGPGTPVVMAARPAKGDQGSVPRSGHSSNLCPISRRKRKQARQAPGPRTGQVAPDDSHGATRGRGLLQATEAVTPLKESNAVGVICENFVESMTK